MNLKYIFLPKPNLGESTAMKRVGLVCYWLGTAWLVPFFFFVVISVFEITTSTGTSVFKITTPTSTFEVTAPDEKSIRQALQETQGDITPEMAQDGFLI
jgi:hypothetical protein